MPTKGIFYSLQTLEEARKHLQKEKQVFVFDGWCLYSCNEGMLAAFECYGWGPAGQSKDKNHEIEFCILFKWFSNGQKITFPKGKFRIFSSWEVPGTDDYDPYHGEDEVSNNEQRLWTKLERLEKSFEKKKESLV